MTLTPEQVALREAAMAATPGPRIAGDDEDSDMLLVGPETYPGLVTQPVVSLHNEANAVYIAAANPAAILALLAQLEVVPSVPAQTGTRPDFSKFATLEEYRAAVHAFEPQP